MGARNKFPAAIPVATTSNMLRWPSGFLEISMRPRDRCFYLRRDGGACITIPFDQVGAVHLVLQQMAIGRPVRDTRIGSGK